MSTRPKDTTDLPLYGSVVAMNIDFVMLALFAVNNEGEKMNCFYLQPATYLYQFFY